MNGHNDVIGSIGGTGSIINNSSNTFEGLSLDNTSTARTFTGNISGNGRLGLRGGVSAAGSLTLSGGSYAFSRIALAHSSTRVSSRARS